MSQTVGELIRELEQFDEDALVFLAQQPSWPFEYEVGEVVQTEASDECDDCGGYIAMGEESTPEGADRCECGTERTQGGVYIGEGRQTRYLPGDVASELGWR